MPGLQVRFPVRVCESPGQDMYRRQPLNASFSHQCFSLSLPLSLFLFLKAMKKHVFRGRLKIRINNKKYTACPIGLISTLSFTLGHEVQSSAACCWVILVPGFRSESPHLSCPRVNNWWWGGGGRAFREPVCLPDLPRSTCQVAPELQWGAR